jgi:hypothetical protein
MYLPLDHSRSLNLNWSWPLESFAGVRSSTRSKRSSPTKDTVVSAGTLVNSNSPTTAKDKAGWPMDNNSDSVAAVTEHARETLRFMRSSSQSGWQELHGSPKQNLQSLFST